MTIECDHADASVDRPAWRAGASKIIHAYAARHADVSIDKTHTCARTLDHNAAGISRHTLCNFISVCSVQSPLSFRSVQVDRRFHFAASESV